MHKIGLTTKPVEPTGTFNGLLHAVQRGAVSGDFPGQLVFEGDLALANPDNALRGHQNGAYVAVPRLLDIDPTSSMALEITSAHRRNPRAGTGYTHEFVALDYLSAISAQFANWFREFQTLFEAALKAEKSLSSGAFTPINRELDVRYGEGDMEAYLAAVGDITAGTFSYPASKPLDITSIHNHVLSSLTANLGVLDNVGFIAGENAAKRSIGIASIPKTGQPLAVLSSNTMDRLHRSPWRRILTCPRARDLVEERFMERYDEASARLINDDQFVRIAEGDDILTLPVNMTWDQITAAIDARDDLQIALTAPLADAWTQQFYTKGDLVQGYLSGDVVLLQAARTCVALAPPAVGAFGTVLGPVAGNQTGALSSLNLIGDDLFNWIQGSHDINAAVNGVGVPVGATLPDYLLGTGCTSSDLPTGMLYLGVCGEATAQNWTEILRSLDLNLRADVKQLLSKTGRSKLSLPKGVPTLSGVDAVLQSALAHGIRDGYVTMPALAFNVTRMTRDEQEGPAFAAASDGASASGTISTYPLSDVNGWDRIDDSDGRYVHSPFGIQIELLYGTSSRFTGEWDAGRYAAFADFFAGDAIAAGSSNIEAVIANNLMSLPCVQTADRVYTHRYSPAGGGNFAQYILDQTIENGSELQDITFPADTQFPQYTNALTYESYHPARGFMRGYASFIPGDTRNNATRRAYDAIHSLINTRGRAPAAGGLTTTGGVDHLVTSAADRKRLPCNDFSDTAEGSVSTAWMWDPTRVTIFGEAWHRWAGFGMDETLPHPYMQHPVAACTSAMSLADLATDSSIAERPTSTLVVTRPILGAATPRAVASPTGTTGSWNSPVSRHDRRPVTGDADTGPVFGHAYSAVASGSSSSYKAQVGDIVAASMMDQRSLNADPNFTLNPAVGNPQWNGIPFVEAAMPLVNACSRFPAFVACAPNLGNDVSGAIASPVGPSGTPIDLPTAQAFDITGAGVVETMMVDTAGAPGGADWVSLLEGELLIPSFNSVAGGGNSAAGVSIIISGNGVLFEGDLTTDKLMDPKYWLSTVFNSDTTVAQNPFCNYWPVTFDYGVGSAVDQVEKAFTACNFVPANQPACGQVFKTHTAGLANYEVISLDNDWFRKGVDLQPRQARMRSMGLVNPWIRASGDPGIAHLRYESPGVLRIYTDYVKGLASVGQAYQKGLENSLFLELHQAN